MTTTEPRRPAPQRIGRACPRCEQSTLLILGATDTVSSECVDCGYAAPATRKAAA